MDNPVVILIAAVVALVVGLVIGFVLGGLHRKKVAEAAIGSAEKEANKIITPVPVNYKNACASGWVD